MPRKTIIALGIIAFAAGFFLWSLAEVQRERNSPFREIRIPALRSQWNLLWPFSAANIIGSPLPKAVVTEVERADTLILSTRTKIRLAGVELASRDPQLVKEAQDLADRLVARREVFLEYEPRFKKNKGPDWAYVFFRIPIIPSNPPVGPEYVHWSLNAELIKLGYARVDDSIRFKYLKKFREYEKNAKAQRRGLWKTI